MKPAFRTDPSFRIGLPFTWSLGHVLIALLAFAMAQLEVLASGWIALLLLSVFWTVLSVYTVVTNPEVTVSEEGVSVQRLFEKRLIPWSGIIQAGILWHPGGNVQPNHFVLLMEGGSPRRYGESTTFIFRNTGKLLFISNTPETRQLVVRYYGPLDFDLSDGRPERSEVV